MLLGLVRGEEGDAAGVLESLGLTIERARAEVGGVVGLGGEVTSGQIPFSARGKEVLELALDEALSLGHDYVGAEHILLALLGEQHSVAARILLDFDASADKIREQLTPMPFPPGSTIGEPPGSAGARPDFPSASQEPPPLVTGVDLGWRGRPIALAALGAAVLARAAFDPVRIGRLEPLEMQLLARLALESPDGPAAGHGELFESLTVALVCDHDELREAILLLADQRLIVTRHEQDDDQRILITAPGASRVHEWLRATGPLFGRWPPNDPAADDAAA